MSGTVSVSICNRSTELGVRFYQFDVSIHTRTTRGTSTQQHSPNSKDVNEQAHRKSFSYKAGTENFEGIPNGHRADFLYRDKVTRAG